MGFVGAESLDGLCVCVQLILRVLALLLVALSMAGKRPAYNWILGPGPGPLLHHFVKAEVKYLDDLSLFAQCPG